MACIGHIKVNCEWGSIFITPTVQCLIIPCNQCMSAGLWGLDCALCASFQEWGTKKSFSNKSNWLVRKGFLVNQCISFSLHGIDQHLLCLHINLTLTQIPCQAVHIETLWWKYDCLQKSKLSCHSIKNFLDSYMALLQILLPQLLWFLLTYTYALFHGLFKTRDLPGVALVITFFMTLFKVHRKI